MIKWYELHKGMQCRRPSLSVMLESSCRTSVGRSIWEALFLCEGSCWRTHDNEATPAASALTEAEIV